MNQSQKREARNIERIAITEVGTDIKKYICQICTQEISPREILLCSPCDKEIRREYTELQKQYLKHVKWWAIRVLTDTNIRFTNK